MWSVSTGAGANLDADELVGVLAAHHERLVDTWTGFTSEQWSHPSRNSRWTVHDTVRHVADAIESSAAALTGEPSPFSVDGFDPHTTPDAWLSLSADEAPSATVDRFAVAAVRARERVGARAAAGDTTIQEMVYGPVHWSVGVVHVFWDSWVHERDVLLPLGLPAPSTTGEQRLAGMYGLLMATLPARMAEQPFAVAVRYDAPVDRTVTSELDAGTIVSAESSSIGTNLVAEVADLVDALSGRGRPVADVLPGAPDLLGAFAAFMAS